MENRKNNVTEKSNADKKIRPKIVQLQETDEIDAYIRFKTDNNNIIKEVYGYGVIRGTRDRADGCRDHHQKVRYGDVTGAINGVINAVMEDWRREKLGTYETLAGAPTSLQEALKKILDGEGSYDKVVNSVMTETGYAESTTRSALSYLVNSIAKYVRTPDEDLVGVYENLCLQGKKNSGEKYKARTKKTVGNEIVRALKVYRVIKDLYPREMMYYGELRIPIPDMGRAIDKEQKKSISPRERVIAAMALLELARAGVPYAFGASLMFFDGLRRGEASAPCMGEITGYDNDRYGSYLVAYQMQNKSELERLKTDDSCRWIVLPRIAMAIYEIRRTQLLEKGYSEAQIGKIPYTSETDEEKGFVQPGKLSAFLKNVYIRSGVEADKFRAADAEEEDYVERFEEGDYVGHLSRRDFAGRCLNTCGISPAEADYLLGHKSNELDYRQMAFSVGSRQWAKEIAARLERYVFLPELSDNPEILPVELRNGMRIVLHGSLRTTYIADEDCVVHIALNNTESNDTLKIKADKAPSPRTLKKMTVIEQSGGRKSRFIPQRTVLEQEEYKMLCAQGKKVANDILREGGDT